MNSRELSPTAQAFYNQLALWLSFSDDERRDADVRPLSRAAAEHLKLGRALPISEVAPCLGAVYFSVVEFECSRWKRSVIRVGVWLLRRIVYRARPMWNDFWMCLWQLSRDPRYVGRLHSHLKRANQIQLETGHWMVTSVCQQDPVFAEHWGDVVQERGEVFA